MTPGVFELETSIAPGRAAYPMNVTERPSVDKFSASSDLEEKLVTRWSPARPRCEPSGTHSLFTRWPDGVSWSRNAGDVMPKLPSTSALSHTCGNVPPLLAVAQPLVQPGGSTVTPGTRLTALASYTEPLTSRFPGRKYEGPSWRADPAGTFAAAISKPPVSTVTASIIGMRQRERRRIIECKRSGVIGRDPPPPASPMLTRRRTRCSPGKAIPRQPRKP